MWESRPDASPAARSPPHGRVSGGRRPRRSSSGPAIHNATVAAADQGDRRAGDHVAHAAPPSTPPRRPPRPPPTMGGPRTVAGTEERERPRERAPEPSSLDQQRHRQRPRTRPRRLRVQARRARRSRRRGRTRTRSRRAAPRAASPTARARARTPPTTLRQAKTKNTIRIVWSRRTRGRAPAPPEAGQRLRDRVLGSKIPR